MESGKNFSKASKNVTSLTLAFANAVAKRQDDQSDNVVVSAYNAMSCLGMLMTGADNDTKKELAKTLFNASPEEAKQSLVDFISLNHEILDANKDQVTLKSANAIWANKNQAPLDEKFAQDIRELFDGGISQEDFSSQATVDKINKWASDNTNDLINKIVTQLNPDDVAVLASALYFKGDWTHKFDEELTVEEEFNSDDDQNLTQMMNKFFKEGQSQYQEGDDYDSIALTYGDEEKAAPTMRMVLIRPKDDQQSARKFMEQYDGQDFPNWLEPANFERVTATVKLPHIDIEQDHDIKPVLEDMGIKQIFDERAADLLKMSSDKENPLVVSKISHQTAFKTDEKGSELAAITTANVMRATAFMPEPVKHVDMFFDRSFAFALQDIKTGALIFSGTINKPNKEMKPLLACNKKRTP